MRKHTLNQANKQAAKVALVTGGARRIGAAIVKQLHGAGFKVVIHCHQSLDEAHALAVDLNHLRMDSAFVLSRELNREDAAAEMIATTIDWAGRLDLLVNNASIFTRNGFDSFVEKEWDDLFDINVKVPYLLSLAARPWLAKTQGAIINLTDTHAGKPLKGYAIYCQTKAALEMQTKALAREFAPEIRVNGVAPGAIVWPEHANALSATQQQQIIERTPLKQHGSPEFIAQAVLALAENAFITGQILKVDGGRSVL
ncbi:MAG: pteridine reductase [Legionella sp.]|nr:MAG: pteridine reductase [Legionella sp.]